MNYPELSFVCTIPIILPGTVVRVYHGNLLVPSSTVPYRTILKEKKLKMTKIIVKIKKEEGINWWYRYGTGTVPYTNTHWTIEWNTKNVFTSKRNPMKVKTQ